MLGRARKQFAVALDDLAVAPGMAALGVDAQNQVEMLCGAPSYVQRGRRTAMELALSANDGETIGWP